MPSNIIIYLFVDDRGDVWYSLNKDEEPTFLYNYPLIVSQDGSEEITVPLCIFTDDEII